MGFMSPILTPPTAPAGDVEDAAVLDEPEAHPDASSLLRRLSWDSLRLLLCLEEAGSFRAAAATGGVSLNTMRAKIEQLERQFGGPLLTRSVEGVRMTQDGRELVSIARDMRSLRSTTRRVTEAGLPRPRDVLRITITEGLGTYWLVPKLVEFGEQHKNLRLDLSCTMTAPDVLFRDTDISVQLTRPENPNLVVERLGTLHVMPFATDAYLRRFGTPTSLADAKDHRLVWQVADQLPIEILHNFVEPSVADRAVVVQTNTSSAQFVAIANGAGIGLLPSYARAISAAMRPVDVGFVMRHDILMAYHGGALTADVEAGLAWLRHAFDAALHPWFGDAFIHPNDIGRKDQDAVVVNLFDDPPGI